MRIIVKFTGRVRATLRFTGRHGVRVTVRVRATLRVTGSDDVKVTGRVNARVTLRVTVQIRAKGSDIIFVGRRSAPKRTSQSSWCSKLMYWGYPMLFTYFLLLHL